MHILLLKLTLFHFYVSLVSDSNRFSMAKKLEAKGGNGGKEWDDGANHEGVSQIYIREGCEGIESIKFDYVKNGQPIAGPIHGGSPHNFTEWVSLQTLSYFVAIFKYVWSHQFDFEKFGIHSSIITDSSSIQCINYVLAIIYLAFGQIRYI